LLVAEFRTPYLYWTLGRQRKYGGKTLKKTKQNKKTNPGKKILCQVEYFLKKKEKSLDAEIRRIMAQG
jgi:hypothetical protein